MAGRRPGYRAGHRSECLDHGFARQEVPVARGSYHAQFAAQHVDELGQFIDRV
jgi:hypothetical protein